MAKQREVHIIREAVEAAILGKGTRKKYVAAAAQSLRQAHPATYAGSLDINTTALSRMLHAPVGHNDYEQSRATAQLLADALGVPVESISEPVAASTGPQVPYQRALRPTVLAGSPAATAEMGIPPQLTPGSNYQGFLESGLLASLPYLNLPFTAATARADFVARRCAGQIGEPETTIRYVLPPRPLTEYELNHSGVFESWGDALEPEVRNGECLVADFVPETRWELLANRTIVICYDNVLTIKYVRENELLARSVLTLYPREGLAPLTVRRSLIRCIHVVREAYSRKSFD